MSQAEQRQSDIVLTKTLDVLIATVAENSRIQAESGKKTNDMLSKVEETLGALKECNQELLQSEKVRLEKDKYQSEKNEKFEGFVIKYTTSLDRLVNWHQALDKAKVPLIVSFIVLTGTAFGIDWKG